jgi:hypothetical protein
MELENIKKKSQVIKFVPLAALIKITFHSMGG